MSDVKLCVSFDDDTNIQLKCSSVDIYKHLSITSAFFFYNTRVMQNDIFSRVVPF